MENLKIHYKELVKLQSFYKYLLKETPLTYCHFPIIEPIKILKNPTLYPVEKQKKPIYLILIKHYQHFNIFYELNRNIRFTSIFIDDILAELPEKFDAMKRAYYLSNTVLERNFSAIHLEVKGKCFFDKEADDFLFEFSHVKK